MNKRVRIKDIAEHLGLSPSTVSRALNPETMSMISAEVVAEVKQTARKLGYIVDVTAAGLRRQKTFTVGMVVPDILNPVFPPIIAGVQNYLSDQGYVTFVVYSNNDQHTATAEIKNLVARKVDGIILASAFLKDSSVRFCIEQSIPLVLVNRSIQNGSLVHQVLDDDSHGISLAIDHLHHLGHRQLVHFAGPQNILHGIQRLQAFTQDCEALGLGHEIVELDSFTVEAGREGIRQITSRNLECSAIVAGNDLIAVGAIQALQELGVRVPKNISIVGFNGMPFSEMFNPPLTTVAIPHKNLGQQAARLLLEEINNPGGPKQKVLLTPTLLVRGSATRAPEKINKVGTLQSENKPS